jgi:hypothetical protein
MVSSGRRARHSSARHLDPKPLVPRRLRPDPFRKLAADGARRTRTLKGESCICPSETEEYVHGFQFSSTLQCVQREIELKHVDMGLPDDAEQTGVVWSVTSCRTRSSGRLRVFATRGTWNSAAAGVISGSSPLAGAVTRSIGIGAFGFSAASFAASSFTRSIRAFDVAGDGDHANNEADEQRAVRWKRTGRNRTDFSAPASRPPRAWKDSWISQSRAITRQARGIAYQVLSKS